MPSYVVIRKQWDFNDLYTVESNPHCEHKFSKWETRRPVESKITENNAWLALRNTKHIRHEKNNKTVQWRYCYECSRLWINEMLISSSEKKYLLLIILFDLYVLQSLEHTCMTVNLYLIL